MIQDESILQYDFHRLSRNEIGAIVGLSENLGWDYSEKDVEGMMRSGVFFGHRNGAGKVISTAAIFPYGNLASLGVVMVDPGYRRKGLATEAIRACLGEVPGFPVTLVATEEGVPLYEKLGFRMVDTLDKLVAKRWSGQKPSEEGDGILRPLTEADIEPVLKLDRKVFGANRETLLKWRIRQARERVLFRSPTGEISGFALGVQGPDVLLIGPVIAPDPASAAWLIHRIASGHPGPMRIDLFSGHRGLSDWLIRNGFVRERKPPVMLKDGVLLPSGKNLIAVASQAFG
ncbi:acetyltransferase (GNAT) family protein [Melghirimyces profundicolus]|uniref:Acetyltransferase (GNAT) family protein n=1 Tax=Melghirimyces profundicolus TaxID=1242148 RepID=A0A2T6C7L3_9BACL|nr:GNAT family N-acetyltransferase [Melghirimyces profundicolus]PTX64295.1 acetyltransferase (GNAT) family protein [Melghirimyces profundicolus]